MSPFLFRSLITSSVFSLTPPISTHLFRFLVFSHQPGCVSLVPRNGEAKTKASIGPTASLKGKALATGESSAWIVTLCISLGCVNQFCYQSSYEKKNIENFRNGRIQHTCVSSIIIFYFIFSQTASLHWLLVYLILFTVCLPTS